MDPLNPEPRKQPAKVAVPAIPRVETITYSVSEAAIVIGVSKVSVYRLLARRLLKPVPGLRRKRIAKRLVHRYAEGPWLD